MTDNPYGKDLFVLAVISCMPPTTTNQGEPPRVHYQVGYAQTTLFGPFNSEQEAADYNAHLAAHGDGNERTWYVQPLQEPVF